MKYQRKLTFGLLMIAFLVVLATGATAQQQPVPLKVANIRGNVYWTQGSVETTPGSNGSLGLTARLRKQNSITSGCMCLKVVDTRRFGLSATSTELAFLP